MQLATHKKDLFLHNLLNIYDQTIRLKRERYQACMLLAAVGDALGYRDGMWEFTHSGPQIHKQMMEMTKGTGVLFIELNHFEWPYSDDTVMHFATARGLVGSKPSDQLSSICLKVAKEYKACWKFMDGRGPGSTCRRTISQLMENGSNWNQLEFDPRGQGCGAAMRAACIGLYFPSDLQKLIAVAVETGRTTHHNPIGYLGSVVAAYFTALALRGENLDDWLYLLFQEALPLTRKYIENSRQAEVNLGQQWQMSLNNWRQYAKLRHLSLESRTKPLFPQVFGPVEREKFYSSIAFAEWPGGKGVDSVIIAYDALLGARDNWEELCLRGMLHGGDSDSTGTIAAAWFGAAFGYKSVPKNHIDHPEGKEEALLLGEQLYDSIHK